MTSDETDHTQEESSEELRKRLHFINQCSELGSLATSAEQAFVREAPDEARADLRELRGRLQSVLEDLDELEEIEYDGE